MSRKNARIFLVEDDVSFGSVLKSYLEINDFEVDLVDDGKLAVETFRRGVYDLCILDVMLPHVDELRPIHNLNAMKDLCRALSADGDGKAEAKYWLNKVA